MCTTVTYPPYERPTAWLLDTQRSERYLDMSMDPTFDSLTALERLALRTNSPLATGSLFQCYAPEKVEKYSKAQLSVIILVLMFRFA